MIRNVRDQISWPNLEKYLRPAPRKSLPIAAFDLTVPSLKSIAKNLPDEYTNKDNFF